MRMRMRHRRVVPRGPLGAPAPPDPRATLPHLSRFSPQAAAPVPLLPRSCAVVFSGKTHRRLALALLRLLLVALVVVHSCFTYVKH
jgi:hypothetical protein